MTKWKQIPDARKTEIVWSGMTAGSTILISIPSKGILKLNNYLYFINNYPIKSIINGSIMKSLTDYFYRVLKSQNRLFLPLFIFFFITSSSPELTFGQEQFFMEESPAPLDQSELQDIDSDHQGRLVAVGRQRELVVGGSPFYPLVMIKDTPQDPWAILDPPNFGWTWYELTSVNFIPGTDGDFVAVGEYLPDPLLAHPNGFLLRYYRNTNTWNIQSFQAPGAQFHFIRDAVFDPNDSTRLLIVGTRGISDPGGFCFEFYTMVVDYNINTLTYAVLPTTQKGALWAIEPLPNGNFLSVGPAAADCDYLPYPLVMELELGVEIVHPIPPPATNGYFYDISAMTVLDNGDVFMVAHESPFGGSDFSTLSYRYNPVTQEYTFYKPLDPDSTDNFTNQFWSLEATPNGLIYGVGRTHYIYEGLHFWKAMIQSFDGERWRLHPLPAPFNEGYVSQLWGMTALVNNKVFAVGQFRYGSILYYDWQTLVMHNELITEVSGEESAFSPSQFLLHQNYPNPFNPSTTISFSIPSPAFTTLKVYDILGNEVTTLVNEEKSSGVYNITFEASVLTSGIYFYKLTAGEYSESKKMVLVK